MSPQAIFLDIDGTLIGSSGQVEAPVLEALDAARAAGVRLIICTGRCRAGLAERLARRADADALHVFEAGALIVQHDTILVRELLDRAIVEAQITLARRMSLPLEIYTTEGIFVDHHTPRGLRHARVLDITSHERDLMDVAASCEVIRLHWICDAADSQIILANPPRGCLMAPAQSEALPGDTFISVTRQGVSKGSAIRVVAERMGLDLARCAAIGDSYGDLSMLEIVGAPFIMAAAPVALRARFTNVPDVDAHGAREAILSMLE
jgi:Cof subfamily protein (haloacid dehalogenase superfamily)